ncbi:MAG TPA: hypothetical protein GXX17_03615 [Clostridiales bacterium]|nr:hypothetical protein [Clostridiales bacterium]
MLRGVNRQIIEVNNTGNRYFEKVILFVKPEYSDASRHKLEDEAYQLLESFGQPPPLKSSRQIIKQKAKIRRRIKRALIYLSITVSPLLLYCLFRLMF